MTTKYVSNIGIHRFNFLFQSLFFLILYTQSVKNFRIFEFYTFSCHQIAFLSFMSDISKLLTYSLFWEETNSLNNVAQYQFLNLGLSDIILLFQSARGTSHFLSVMDNSQTF